MGFFNVISFLIKNTIVSSVQTSIVMFYNQSMTLPTNKNIEVTIVHIVGSILLTYICKDYLTTLRLKQIDWALFYLASGGSGTSTRQFVSYVSKQSGVGLRFSIRHWNITVVQSNLAIRNGLIRNKLVIRNHFLWPIWHLLHKDKELLAFQLKGTILGWTKSSL